MRRFKPTKGDFLTGVRSKSNGPIEMAHYETTDDNGMPFIVPYKVAKPYIAVVAGKPVYEMLGTNLLPRSECPDVAEIAFNILNGRNDLISSPFANQVDLDYAINGAIESSQAYGELLMLVTAGEAKTTIRMVRSLFIRVFNIVLDIYNAVKRLNVVATIDLITDVWLEYRYGWRPFIGEINSIHKALTVERPLGVKSAYGLHKSEANSEIFNETVEIDREGYKIMVDASLTFKGNPTVKAGYNYMNKPNSRNDSWSAIFGLDFGSLASTAWELVPFSFIIDMFLNLGSCLQARDFADQVDSFNGYITCQSSIEVDAQVVSISKDGRKSIVDLFTSEQSAELGYESPSTELFVSCLYETQNMLEAAVHMNAVSQEQIYVASYGGEPHEDEAIVRTKVLNKAIGYYEDGAVSEYKKQLSFRAFRHDLGTSWIRNEEYYSVTKSFVAHFGFLPSAAFVTEYLVLNPLVFDGQVISTSDVFFDTLASIGNKYGKYLLHVNWDITTNYGAYGSSIWEGHAHLHYSLSTSVDGDEDLPLENLENLRTRGDVLATQRFLTNDFSHSFTADADISSGQYADLSAFAFKLGQFFLSKK